MAQWLRVHASTAGGVGSTPGQETKIPHAPGPKKKGMLIFYLLPGQLMCVVVCSDSSSSFSQAPESPPLSLSHICAPPLHSLRPPFPDRGGSVAYRLRVTKRWWMYSTQGSRELQESALLRAFLQFEVKPGHYWWTCGSVALSSERRLFSHSSSIASSSIPNSICYGCLPLQKLCMCKLCGLNKHNHFCGSTINTVFVCFFFLLE